MFACFNLMSTDLGNIAGIRTGGTEISEPGRRQGDVPDLYQGVNSSEVCRSPLQRATHRVERIFQPLLLRQAVISKII